MPLSTTKIQKLSRCVSSVLQRNEGKKMKKCFIELKLFHCWANSIYHLPPDLTPLKTFNASAVKM